MPTTDEDHAVCIGNFQRLSILGRALRQEAAQYHSNAEESGIVPKVLVLCCGDENSATLGAAAAEGARSVRFTEVDVRSVGESVGRRLASPESALDYDGIVLAAAPGSVAAELQTVIDAVATGAGAANVVWGLAASNVELHAWLCDTAAIVAGVRRGHGSAHDAKHAGARVAKVAGWVRHALGHEAGGAHSHHHDDDEHSHGDHRHDGHQHGGHHGDDHHHEGHQQVGHEPERHQHGDDQPAKSEHDESAVSSAPERAKRVK